MRWSTRSACSTHSRADAVDSVEVTIGQAQAAMLRNHRPSTGLEAKFSMEFAIASALTARWAGLSELTDDFVRREAVQSLLPRVTLKVIDSVAEDDAAFAAYDQVRVRLTDGRELASPEIRFARGHWSLPLSRDELWTKFKDCTAGALAAGAAAALFEALQAIETVATISDLRRQPASRARAS